MQVVTTRAELLQHVDVVYQGERVLVYSESAADVNAVMAELVREGLNEYKGAILDRNLWVASFEAPPIARREAQKRFQNP